MNVEFWNSLFQVASLALILATFAFGAGALWTGNRINARQTARLVTLETELEKSKERAAKAEAELLAKITPRHLTADQKDQLVARLSAKPKGTALVECPVSDAEACMFAEELQSVLNDAGWTTSFIQAALVRVPVGVQLTQHSEGDGVPEMNALYAALRAFNVDTSGAFDPSVPEGRVKLLVGRKP
jgi:hypothetical protein